ncbi:MAG: lipopolysaccharide biosynthesis protein [Bacteroidales bacterium]|nr:lipopolysaccharide biosynthesis protein [Bacteroidales bacterium]
MSKTSIKTAALINAVGKYSRIIFTLVMNIILARILSPEDFGIVAVITVFSTFFVTLSDVGLSVAIVQDKTLTRKDIDSLFSFSFYISLALMLLFVILSFPIAYFYENKEYVGLGVILSVSLFFNALNMVPNGVLNREKRFTDIALRTIIASLVSSVITVILALNNFRFYALALYSVLFAFIQFVWNYFSTKPKFFWRVDWALLKRIGGYSGYQFAFNLVNYFSRNLDNLLTGKYIGVAPLGQYNKAYNLMLTPVVNLAGVVSPVLHPILSDFQDDKKAIYSRFIKLVKMLFLTGVIISAYSWLAHEEIVEILYGGNWSDAAMCFQLLALAIIPQMLNSAAGAIFQSLGNTRLLFINGLINSTITIIAIVLGIFLGGDIFILSMCVCAAYVIHGVISYYMLIRLGFKFSLIDFIKDIYKEILIMVVVFACVLLCPVYVENVFLSALLKGLWTLVPFCVGLAVSGEWKILRLLLK